MPIQRLQTCIPNLDSLTEYVILALQSISLDVAYHML